MKKLFALLLAAAMLLGGTSALAADFTFADIAGLEFDFASGVGAWATLLYVDETGHFTAHYYDADQGDTGDDYPHGTLYECDYEGLLEIAEKVDDCTYTLNVAELTYDADRPAEKIVDGIRVVAAPPVGMENAKQLTLYLPGKPVSELPQGFMDWSHLQLLDETPDTLPWYGLYNAADEVGFVGMQGE
ncbi:MAG: hypothetical protein Q4C54_10505 [Clostridia bacterium]|nr:hypothetical protein [Clostridia bacterium]